MARCIKKCEYDGKMFRVPPEPTRRAKWFNELNIEHSAKVNLYVCAKHFSANQFSAKRLNLDAVPDTCLGNKSPTKLELKDKVYKLETTQAQMDEKLAQQQAQMARLQALMEEKMAQQQAQMARLQEENKQYQQAIQRWTLASCNATNNTDGM